MGDKQWQEIKSELTGKFNKMMKGLFRQKGAQLDINILASDEAQKFITTHAGVLDAGFQKVEMSDKMRERLTRSNYIFSGIKTFHELNEAFPSMLDENGNKKTFERFLNDVQKINDTYNANYLHAEYNFVQASATMAAKWEQFQQDGDQYYLQYRTAKDDKVRPEHAALDGVTLPPSDSFWDTYYPPNGWNCRCNVVQVRKQKYPITEHNEAMSRGEEAMNGQKFNIFRFNSGKQGKAIPDYNPYTIRRCNDCNIAKGKIKLARSVSDNELCAACKLIRAQKHNNTGASERIQKYNEEIWEHTYTSPNDNGLVATQLERIAEAAASNSERQKFDKEMRMCKVLADNGHDIEYLQGVNRPAGQTYDITIDDMKADLKCITGGAGNIVKYAKKAMAARRGSGCI